MGGGAEVVTNGAMMREEPAEMEIPLEEEEVAFFVWVHLVIRTHEIEMSNNLH